MAAIAAAKQASPPSKAPGVITKERLVATLAEQHHLSKRASQQMLNDLISMIAKHLRKGERVKIAGLGVWQIRHRAARMGRKSKAGEVVKIKAGKKVAFRAGKKLKMAI